MRSRSPSIVPPEANQDTYLVLDDFGGRLGRAWRETDEEDTDRETLIRDLMDDQYSHPARIVAFNTAEGWSRDVTMDIADELRRRFAEYDEVPASVQEFLETASRNLDSQFCALMSGKCVPRSCRSPDWVKVKNRKHPAMSRVAD